jgi:hypothetical protein
MILCFIIPHTPVYAALTMSTVLDEVDAWQAVTASTMVVGSEEDIHLNYRTFVCIEWALIEAVAHDGSGGISIEISYGDDNWIEWWGPVGVTAETAATTQTAEDPTPAGDTTVTLDDSATGDFDVVGRKWFIKDGTIANSESVKTKSDAANVVTLCQDTLRAHAVDSDCYDRVDEWVVLIPGGVAYFRILVNNGDADCDGAFTSRRLNLTGL